MRNPMEAQRNFSIRKCTRCGERPQYQTQRHVCLKESLDLLRFLVEWCALHHLLNDRSSSSQLQCARSPPSSTHPHGLAQVGRPEPGPVAVFVVFDFFAACVLEEDSAAMPPCMRFAMRGFEGGLSALTLDDLSALGTGGPALLLYKLLYKPSIYFLFP